MPASALVKDAAGRIALADQLGYPGGDTAVVHAGRDGRLDCLQRARSFPRRIAHALDASPVHEALVEESVLGWKEFELEVMRDCRDNFVVICSIENFDPMGVHTGDSITVAPAQTLTDKEYQRMRDASARDYSRSGRGDGRVKYSVRRRPGKRAAWW